MKNLIAKINPALYLTLVLAFGGCSHLSTPATDSSIPANPAVLSDQYAEEIVKLNRVVQQNSESDEAKNTHLKLAKLYIHHQNRNRNYPKALEHLEAYILLQKSGVDDQILDWLASLKEIDRLSKEVAAQAQQIDMMQEQLKQSKKTELALSRTNHKLTRKEIKLRDKNRKLQASNQKLQKTIEMLKNLDRRLEEKRKNFSN